MGNNVCRPFFTTNGRRSGSCLFYFGYITIFEIGVSNSRKMVIMDGYCTGVLVLCKYPAGQTAILSFNLGWALGKIFHLKMDINKQLTQHTHTHTHTRAQKKCNSRIWQGPKPESYNPLSHSPEDNQSICGQNYVSHHLHSPTRTALTLNYIPFSPIDFVDDPKLMNKI